MRVAKDDVEVRMNIPGAVVRQRRNFGDVSGYGRISGGYFSLAKGVEGDLCQCPHWGFVLNGRIATTDGSGKQETVTTDDLFYWPLGHNVRVDEDASIVMFSPEHEHSQVIDHMIRKAGG